MAKAPVYVNPIDVKSPADKKYESSLPKPLKAGLEKAIDRSSKVESSDNKKAALTLDGNFTISLNKNKLGAKLSVVMSKERSIFGMGESSAGFEVDNPDEISEDDVDALVEAILKDIGPKVVKELDKKA